MRFMKRRSVKSSAISKAKKRRMGLPKRTRQAVAKIAKRVLKRTAETKFVSVQNDQLFNSSITSVSECYPVVPQIPQGVDDFQRMGDSIKAKYLIVRGKVQWSKDYLQSNGQTFIPPVTLRVMILSQKSVKCTTDLNRLQVGYFLKDNVATGVARSYTGGQFDNLAPLNTDLLNIHMDKKIKLNWIKPAVTAGGGSTDTSVGNDHTRYFYCKIKLDRTLKFDDNSSNYPNSIAPFICMGGVCDDGETPYTTGTPFHMTYLSTLYFQDV